MARTKAKGTTHRGDDGGARQDVAIEDRASSNPPNQSTQYFRSRKRNLYQEACVKIDANAATAKREARYGLLELPKRLAGLLALAECRYVFGRLPNDRRGRDHLLALLACGMTGPEAFKHAPWLKQRGLDRLIERAEAKSPWTSEALGKMVKLTRDEREWIEHENKTIQQIRPHDVQWEDYQQERSSQRQRRRRARKSEKKNMLRQIEETLSREQVIRGLLSVGWFWSVATLKDTATTFPAFAGLSGKSLEIIIRRIVAKIPKGELESAFKRVDKRSVSVVRLKKPPLLSNTPKIQQKHRSNKALLRIYSSVTRKESLHHRVTTQKITDPDLGQQAVAEEAFSFDTPYPLSDTKH
jgi:hypothetical protein